MSATSSEDLEINRIVLEEITSKWSLIVLGCLCSGPMRFNALRRANPMVTQKALTQCLRRLESNGFITRSVASLAPVAVVYEVSPLGRSLEPHLQAILQWASDHRGDVLSAQQAFAERSGGSGF
ncbi:winged helix-turn-helix transcriptional regulator [Rhizobium halophytocola]|uniref:DNA-binding HxlR family transcriptional regulator n=1 Tax=Rhizobium halophytocola TaxID=735519 RepID=A0ABS4DXE8_9HYPH|nr:helix-turn-helix domain-containing protein [Rhizobium halophytocola]MBP1850294.1 DNA-binding HxlR family transcriptional regulator [Rhizobium halophytocola]